MKLTFDHFKTFLCVLVIPLTIWGIKLEVNNAVMAQSIDNLQTDVRELNDIEAVVQENSLALAQLRERIEHANQTLQDIKSLLRDRNDRGN